MPLFAVAFATVGALLAWQRPGNPTGWLSTAAALTYAAGMVSVSLARVHRTLTLADGWGWSFLLELSAVRVRRLVLPAGQLPSRRWQPAARTAGAPGGPGWVLGNAPDATVIAASPGQARKGQPSKNHLVGRKPRGRVSQTTGCNVLTSRSYPTMASLPPKSCPAAKVPAHSLNSRRAGNRYQRRAPGSGRRSTT